MSNRLYTKIAVNFLILLAGAMAAVTVWFYVTVGRPMARDVHAMLRSHSRFIGAMVETYRAETAPDETCRRFFQLVSERLGVETAVLDAAGNPVITSAGLAGKPLALPARWRHDVGDKGLFAQSSHFGKPVIYVVPLRNPGGPPAYLYTTRRFPAGKHHLAFLAGLLVIGAVLALAAYPLSRSITRPLSDLGQGLEKIAEGDFSAAPTYHRRDEIGRLFRVFRDMRLSVDAMIRANKQLLADISHELRSPLTRIRVGTELLRDHVPGDKAETYLKSIETEIASLDRLVTDLAAYSRMNVPGFTLALEQLSPRDLVAGVRERYRPIAESRDIRLTAVVDPEPATINGDRALLLQVFVNLLDNAFRHVPAGGAITVGAEARPGGICFFVTDTGPGVPEESGQRIFEPLYRVDPSRNSETGGAGLGLAIAKKIVSLHAGEIYYTRENGLTRFFFFLPGQMGSEQTLV